MNENELEALRKRLVRAKELLREWQEEHGERTKFEASSGRGGYIVTNPNRLSYETDLFLRGQ